MKPRHHDGLRAAKKEPYLFGSPRGSVDQQGDRIEQMGDQQISLAIAIGIQRDNGTGQPILAEIFAQRCAV